MMDRLKRMWTTAAPAKYTGALILILSSVTTISVDAPAAEVYQWKDANGVIHYTDNPARVPASFRDKSRQDVVPLAGINPQASSGGSLGRRLWESKCQTCHMYDRDGKEAGRVGIFSALVNPETKFPFSVDVVTDTFKKAAKGTGEGMPAVKISDDEVKALAEFLVNDVSRH